MKRIIGFLISCVVIILIAFGVTNCALLDQTQREIKYMVDGEMYYTQSVFSAAEISLPTNPERENYDFVGWFYDEDVWSKPFDPASDDLGFIFGNIVIYAKWVPHAHTIDGELNKTPYGTFNFTGLCTSCNEDLSDTNVQVDEKIEKNATCLEKGIKIYSYTFEGNLFTYMQEIPITGHQLNGETITSSDVVSVNVEGIVPDGEILCGQTGAAHFKCENCLEDQPVIAKRELHTITNWSLERKNDGNYVVISSCSEANCPDPVVSININKYELSENTISPNCQRDGSIVANYSGFKNGYTISNITYTEILPKASNHMLNGVDINTLAINDYEADGYAVINYYDKNGKPIVLDFGNVNLDDFACKELAAGKNYSFEAYFECSYCKSIGKDNCNALVYVFKNHAKSYSLALNGEFDPTNISNTSFTYTETCLNCEEYSKQETVTYNNNNFANVFTPTPCSQPDYYTITYNDVVKCRIDVPNHYKHKLDGKVMSKDVLDNLIYKLGINANNGGIHLAANAVSECYTATGELQPAYFICDDCGGYIYVEVEIQCLTCSNGSSCVPVAPIAYLNDDED